MRAGQKNCNHELREKREPRFVTGEVALCDPPSPGFGGQAGCDGSGFRKYLISKDCDPPPQGYGGTGGVTAKNPKASGEWVVQSKKFRGAARSDAAVFWKSHGNAGVMNKKATESNTEVSREKAQRPQSWTPVLAPLVPFRGYRLDRFRAMQPAGPGHCGEGGSRSITPGNGGNSDLVSLQRSPMRSKAVAASFSAGQALPGLARLMPSGQAAFSIKKIKVAKGKSRGFQTFLFHGKSNDGV